MPRRTDVWRVGYPWSAGQAAGTQGVRTRDEHYKGQTCEHGQMPQARNAVLSCFKAASPVHAECAVRTPRAAHQEGYICHYFARQLTPRNVNILDSLEQGQPSSGDADAADGVQDVPCYCGWHNEVCAAEVGYDSRGLPGDVYEREDQAVLPPPSKRCLCY